MWKMLRYYWIVARGYRLNPWNSPYLRWRFETFLGSQAAGLDAGKIFHLMWKYRNQMERFMDWAEARSLYQRTRVHAYPHYAYASQKSLPSTRIPRTLHVNMHYTTI